MKVDLRDEAEQGRAPENFAFRGEASGLQFDGENYLRKVHKFRTISESKWACECPHSEIHPNGGPSDLVISQEKGRIVAQCEHGDCSLNSWEKVRAVLGEPKEGDWKAVPIAKNEIVEASEADPREEAETVLAEHSHESVPKIVFWNGSFLYWASGQFNHIPASEARAIVVRSLNKRYKKVGTSIVNNVMEHLRAEAMLSSRIQPPTWIGQQNTWSPFDVVTTQNQIVHLPSFIAKENRYSIPSTPSFFATSAMDYAFDLRAECPRWMEFLKQIWPNDTDSIEALQQWFGYCLTPDTRQQKILFLLGIKRSGKGTICRVLRSLVGENNVAGPTLSSLQTNFGLWPLLGKTLAIVSDARLSGRSDQATIAERLLSISGEDAQTVDRKNLEPITTKLSTRLMIVSNELPRLQDSSGALVGRMIVLKLSESFYGREDQRLSDDLLAERSGILHWAIEGWRVLRERGSFSQPQTGRELVEQMDELASPIMAFVQDRCIVDNRLEVSANVLYAEWCDWCREVGRDASTAQLFGRDLNAYLPRLSRRQIRIGAHRERIYQGIGIGEK